METRHLITFVRAAEMQNFSRAARALGVTQAAISQHVAALEKELAVSLFRRTGRSVNAMAKEIRDGRRIPTKLENVVAQRNLYCITNPERMTTPPCRAFLSFLAGWQEKRLRGRTQ